MMNYVVNQVRFSKHQSLHFLLRSVKVFEYFYMHRNQMLYAECGEKKQTA